MKFRIQHDDGTKRGGFGMSFSESNSSLCPICGSCASNAMCIGLLSEIIVFLGRCTSVSVSFGWHCTNWIGWRECERRIMYNWAKASIKVSNLLETKYLLGKHMRAYIGHCWQNGFQVSHQYIGIVPSYNRRNLEWLHVCNCSWGELVGRNQFVRKLCLYD